MQGKRRHELGTVIKAGNSYQIRGEEGIEGSLVELDFKELVGF